MNKIFYFLLEKKNKRRRRKMKKKFITKHNLKYISNAFQLILVKYLFYIYKYIFYSL
jgi:hypothetical protein